MLCQGIVFYQSSRGFPGGFSIKGNTLPLQHQGCLSQRALPVLCPPPAARARDFPLQASPPVAPSAVTAAVC